MRFTPSFPVYPMETIQQCRRKSDRCISSHYRDEMENKVGDFLPQPSQLILSVVEASHLKYTKYARFLGEYKPVFRETRTPVS